MSSYYVKVFTDDSNEMDWNDLNPDEIHHIEFKGKRYDEVRHGRWLHLHLDPDNITGHTKGECSICGKLRIVDNYCPNCGSRMDLEGDIE